MRFHVYLLTFFSILLLIGCRLRPEGVDYDQWKEALKTRRATSARHVSVPSGFEVDLIKTAAKEEGSWVSLEFDDKGRLLIGREGPGILRLTLSKGYRLCRRPRKGKAVGMRSSYASSIVTRTESIAW